MSKKYLTVDPHGLCGDFYSCENRIFRADNLHIASQVAFNNWLREFDNRGCSCTLKNISDGSFTVEICDHGHYYTETFSVSHHGPADMFEVEYQHKHASPEYHILYAKMIELYESGHPSFRKSKKSGMVIFSCSFPRYRKNGEWWDRETPYLSTDIELAQEQLKYALACPEEQLEICKRNLQQHQQKAEVIYG